MDENLNSVNAEQENVVDSHEGIEQVEAVKTNNVEAVEPQTEKKPEQSAEDNAKYAAARRQAEQQYKAKQDAFAKKYGYDTFEELEAAQAAQEAEEQRQAYINAGIDPDMLNQAINNHPAVKQAQDIANKAKVDSELSALNGKKFFKELEPEIRKVLTINPGLKAEDVYNYIKGVKADELLEKASSTAVKRTVADIADRKSRGLTDTADNNLSNDVELTPEGMEMSRAFGTDPKKVATHVKNQIRR